MDKRVYSQLSEEERRKRLPLAPCILMDALQDPIAVKGPVRARAAKAARAKRPEQT